MAKHIIGEAMDGRRGARKLKDDHPSILSMWQNDEECRTSQFANGWTETYCKYLDYLTTIDISYNATWHTRNLFPTTKEVVTRTLSR